MFTVGSAVAGNRVQRVLGGGGMGTVYLVRHPVLSRFDALKVLSTTLSSDPDFRVRFQREADIAAIDSGMAATYEGSGQQGVFMRNYMPTPPQPGVVVGQGVVSFADAAAAQAFLTQQQGVWQQCANTKVSQLSAQNPITLSVGQPQTVSGVLTVDVAPPGSRCVRTLAAKANVVVDNLVCANTLADQAMTITHAILDKIAP